MMRISRIFCPQISTHLSTLTLNTEASHYLIRVLRHKRNHEVILFNNVDGFEYLANITDADPKKAILTILSSFEKHNESSINIHLFQALSKGDKLESVIQKSTELGVNKITPILTQHVDYKVPAERIDSKLAHWQKIAISASEQSGRVFVPQITTPVGLATAIQTTVDMKLFLSPQSTAQNIDQLQRQFPNLHSFAIYIGPEGGFTDEEGKIARGNHCHSICLGKRILRTETAPLAIISILQAFWGDY